MSGPCQALWISICFYKKRGHEGVKGNDNSYRQPCFSQTSASIQSNLSPQSQHFQEAMLAASLPTQLTSHPIGVRPGTLYQQHQHHPFIIHHNTITTAGWKPAKRELRYKIKVKLWAKWLFTFLVHCLTVLTSSDMTISTHLVQGSLIFSICRFTMVSKAMSGVKRPVLPGQRETGTARREEKQKTE